MSSFRYFLFIGLSLSLILSAHPYEGIYAPLKQNYSFVKFKPSSCFLIVLVDAPHLDYSNTFNLLKSIGKHPRTGCKNGSVGHAWIYLYKDGKIIEGGHSGERGFLQPKYFDGIMDLVEAGDKNPIRYLWAIQRDGFFQQGSGSHQPSLACAIHLNALQYQEIISFLHNYQFKNYCLQGQQCVSLVMQVAALAGLELGGRVSIPVSPVVFFNGMQIPLWTDRRYSILSFYSPDFLELSMLKALNENRAADALRWYKSHKKAFSFIQE